MKKQNNFIILLLLTVVTAILIVATTMNGNLLSPVKQAISTVLTPVQSVVSRMGTAVYNSLTEKRKFDEIVEENKNLQTTIDELMMENTRLEQANFELDRLRDLYKLLVKRLHPDLNPDLSNEQFILFYKAVDAYKNSDINTLRRISLLTDKITETIPNKYEAKKLRYNNLKKYCEEMEREMEEIRKKFPFDKITFKKLYFPNSQH